jgi:putative flippase GtrA
MGPRWQRLAAEVSKFLAVGGLATLVALVLFNLLVHGFSQSYRPLMADHAIAAYLVANTIGMVVSYRGTRSWAFRHREPVHADGGRTAYLAINLVTMGLPVACLWFSRQVLGLTDPISDNLSANVIGLSLGTAARFYLYRTWVFRHPENPGLPATLVRVPTGRSTSDPARTEAP